MSKVNLQKLMELGLEFKKNIHLSESPDISVILPVFNHSAYLRECLLSIAKQAGQKFELICVDDCSTEEAVKDILSAIGVAHSGVRVVWNRENLGIATTQNEAVKLARGNYLAFIDCDDFLAPNALDIVASYIEKFGHPDYVFTDRQNVDEQGNKVLAAMYSLVRSNRGIERDLVDRMVSSHLKIIKRDSYLKAGGGTNRFSGIQDWELALKILRFGRFGYVPEILYYHRIHSNSVTSSDSIAQIRKSNLLRRIYLEESNIDRKYLRQKRANLLENLSIFNIAVATSEPGLSIFELSKIELKDWFCPDEVVIANKRGDLCVLDARGMQTPIKLDFAREFNSYFDFIFADRVTVLSALIGCLWSPHILCSPLTNQNVLIRSTQKVIMQNFDDFFQYSYFDVEPTLSP